MRYIKATCTGVGFITHEDRENFSIQGFGDIWVTDDSQAAIDWSQRVNGIEFTKEDAEALLNAEASAVYSSSFSSANINTFERKPITLP